VGRRLDVDQLVGTTEIAQRLGVKRQGVVHDWRRRHADFPKPVAHLKTALVWYWPDVRKWAKATGRLPKP
jgi:predicted DNA-binding transcriptional regulator AlpA